MRGIINNPGRPSQLPLFLALALHLGALLLALAAPRLIPEKIHLPEVYRVELYNASELPPAPARSVAALPETPARPAAIAITPPPRRLLPTARPLPTPAAKPLLNPRPKPLPKPAAVSLAPLKERLLKEARERAEQASQNRKLADSVDRLRLDLKKQRAEEQSRAANKAAREAIAALYRTNQPRPSPAQGSSTPKPRTAEASGAGQTAPPADLSGPNQKAALAAYVTRLIAHIKPHWVLPEHLDWENKNLSTTIVIRIKRDGAVTATWFEKNSGNTRFDQQVKKVVNNSLPLPPLPPELGKNSEEIGVTFTPGGLQ